MIHSSRFSAILDANVLYPASIRDLLLHLVNGELYIPRWTDNIQKEWISRLLLKRKDLTKESLLRTQAAMNSAFQDANVFHYEALIKDLSLPDKDDRHILAAAIKSKSDIIVTFNTKDFPVDVIKKFNLEIHHPDIFISNLIQLDQSKVVNALKNQVRNLKNPPKTYEEVFETLSRAGLPQSTAQLKALM